MVMQPGQARVSVFEVFLGFGTDSTWMVTPEQVATIKELLGEPSMRGVFTKTGRIDLETWSLIDTETQINHDDNF